MNAMEKNIYNPIMKFDENLASKKIDHFASVGGEKAFIDRMIES